MWLRQPEQRHQDRIPVAGWCGVMDEAGQASWDVQFGPWDTGSLQCPLSLGAPKDGDSACCAPTVVARPHQGCVVALGDTAATPSQ